jgi:SH3 domain protein
MRVFRAAALLASFTLAVAAPALAATSWVKGDVLLNVRAGPGPEFKTLGAITTGDSVSIVESRDGWTHVRSEKAGEGWIPSGFLQEQPPAVVQLQRVEAEAAELRSRVESLTAEAERLRAEHQSLSGKEAQRSEEVQRLTRERDELRLGSRTSELLAGASILLVGGLLGAMASRSGGARRAAGRVRL